jgi:hypothetical protein
MLVPSLLEAPTRKIISIQIIDWVPTAGNR